MATVAPFRSSRSSGEVIGVNLLWLLPGVVGGSEEYTMRLLLGFAERADMPRASFRLRLYCRPELFTAYPALSEAYECVIAPAAAVVPSVGLPGKAARIALEMSWLAYASRHDTLVHHAGGVVPSVRTRPALVTIHDLHPLDMPQNFSAIKRAWLAARLPRSVEVARLILCPSSFTASTIRERFLVRPDKVRVVPHGFVSDSPSQPSAALPPTLSGRRFMLFPAIAYAHKRHVDAVAVLDRLAPIMPDLDLVFTGGSGPADHLIGEDIDRRGLNGRVHRLGRVPASHLQALYQAADLLLFTSAYEGFGNPVLEAMSAGCPVVAARAGAVPEVVGQAGLLADVGDVAEMAALAESVLGDAGLRGRLARLGRERAADFSVESAVKALDSAYRTALRPSAVHRVRAPDGPERADVA